MIKRIIRKILLGLKRIKKKVFDILAKMKYDEYKNPSADQLIFIENSLTQKGIDVLDYYIDIDAFQQFKKSFIFGKSLYGGNTYIYEEKILEHFVAFQLMKMTNKDFYIDVAAGGSPWVKILQEKGFNAVAIDQFKSDEFGHLPFYQMMDATQTSFQANSVNKISLQCAFEMFLHPQDSEFIDEVARILSKDGMVVILPLYMHTHYCGYSSAEYCFSKKYHDPNAKLYYREFNGIPFSRKYDVEALQSRIIERIQRNKLKYKIYIARNAKAIHPEIYLHFILTITKP